MSNKSTVFYRGKQAVSFDFSAEHVSSDGGILVSEKVEREHGILRNFAALIPDNRDSNLVDYSCLDMLKQRVYLMMQGYEDCNDEEKLRNDPVIKQVLGNNLCSQPTLCRFENSIDKHTIFKLCHWFVDHYVSSLPTDTTRIVLDVDSTDDPTHGQQVLSLFNGYYYQWMYNELIINDGETGQIVLPVLRPGNSHSNKWFVAILKRIVKKIKARFPDVIIEIRADSGFSGAAFYKLINQENLVFAVGIAKNQVLSTFTNEAEDRIRTEYLSKNEKHQEIVGPFNYQAGTWDKPQDIYAKVESTGRGMNIRYFVSNMTDKTGEQIYFGYYVKRGDRSENRIKEIKNMCYSDRLSCHSFWANFFRLFLSCLCYEMFRLIKLLIAKDLRAKKWQVSNIRLYLLKIGTIIKIRKRTVTLKYSKAFVYQDLLSKILLQ